MKKILLALIIILFIGFTGCKYDEAYLNAKLPKTMAYFASFQEYNRTLIVGEGLQFKIGAAMAGMLANDKDRTVDFNITKFYPTSSTDTRILLPTNYYNSSDLNGKIRAIIPQGQFIGYFTVKLDSMNFLNDPLTLNGKYTLPIKIVGTSLDSIESGLDSIKVSLNYMAGVDGFYLYQTVIKKEVAGVIIDAKTKTDNYLNESDNSAWRLKTSGPFKVVATSAVAAWTTGLKFSLYVDTNKAVTYESITGQPIVTPEGSNIYDSKTRDFSLNFNYKKAGIADTTYHVSAKLIFRDRQVDNIIQTRDYLNSLNK